MKKKIISVILAASLLICTLSGSIPVISGAEVLDVTGYKVSESDIPLRLYYDEEASHGLTGDINYDEIDTSFGSGAGLLGEHLNDDWEKWSIPIGNGYFGANLFGRTETERIQLTEKTLANPYKIDTNKTVTDGLNNFSETYIDFGHTNSSVSDYSRELDLKTAISEVSYVYDGVTYTREYFTSYPDKALVIRLDASVAEKLSFVLRPTVPYEQEYMNVAGDNGGKTGTVSSSVTDGVGKITLSGTLEYFGIDFVGLYKVYTNGGTVSATTCTNANGETDGTITVSGATSAYIVVTMGTDYELTSETFTASTANKPTQTTTLADAMAKVEGYMSDIEEQLSGRDFDGAYQNLKNRHLADYQELFGRVTFDIDCNESDFELTTDQLLANYQAGSGSSYLEALYFQYGRYLLIASSRSGALPANLQGAWNRYNHAPWSSGYWHNINVQMNYWPAFSTNIAETFEAYVEYNNAYMAKAMLGATSIVNRYNPGVSNADGGNGWSIGTGGYVSDVSGSDSIGNLGFTTQLFWEYYEYTKDEKILSEVVYPVLVEAARFITKMVKEDADGNYIAIRSDSPEQYVNGVWYYTDKGATYAQSFAYQSNYNLLLAARQLGISASDTSHEDHAILNTVLEQIDKYDPIRVGLSGQIKEFFEEDYYGELGDPKHRHISQLVGLYPGNVINGTTPAWIDAAKYTLTERGDEATGWGVAHRLNLWARVQDGERAHDLLEQLLKVNTATNLWDLHPPFQIDGNLGGTSGISEMLLQSHAGYIEPLAAIPAAWANGSYTGLVARGNYVVSAAWADGLATSFNIESQKGGRLAVKYSGITGATVTDSLGNVIDYTVDGDDLISFDTEAGKTYYVFGFKKQIKPSAVTNLTIDKKLLSTSTLTWSEVVGASGYNVYVAKESASAYTFLAHTKNTSYTYTPPALENCRLTFAVTAVGTDGVESDRALVYRNPDDVSANVDAVSASVINGSLQVTVKSGEYSEKYRLYSRIPTSDEWTLVTESKYPVIIDDTFDRSKVYGVSVVNTYGDECDVHEIVEYNISKETVEYDPSNLFTGLVVEPTAEGLAHKHSSATTFGDYGRLTDGDLDNTTGRFSTRATANDVLEGTIYLPSVFVLGELRIYDFNPSDTTANYVGAHLKIDVLLDGEWTTVKEYNSNEEIVALRTKDSSSVRYLSVDLAGVKAHAIRLRFDTPLKVGTEQCSLTIREIQCSGSVVYNAPVWDAVDNVLSGFVFEPTEGGIGSGVWGERDYTNLTDGQGVGADGLGNFNNSDRFATSGPHAADGTVDFGDRVFELKELKIVFTGGTANALCGSDLTVYAYRLGQWEEVFAQVHESAVATFTVDLAGIEAEKLRFTISSPFVVEGGGGYIGISEIYCTGSEILGAEVGEYIENILLGTTSESVTLDNAKIHTNATVGDIAFGFDGNTGTRYAVGDAAGAYSLIIELDGTYSLGDITFKSFSDGADASYDYARSDDTVIEVFYLGEWTAVTESFKLSKGTMTLSLGDAKAQKIKITFHNTQANTRASLWEIECSGKLIVDAPKPVDNVLTDYVFTPTDSTAAANVWYGYDNLTDGLTAWNEYDRFATKGTHTADGTLDFGGKVYALDSFRILYTGGVSDCLCGKDITIYVYRNGEWKQVLSQIYETAVADVTFDLGCVEAEKIRFTVSGRRGETFNDDGSIKDYVSIAEMYCTGYEMPKSSVDVETLPNVLEGTTAGQLSLNNATVHPSVPDLYKVFDGDEGTRFAVMSATGVYNLEIVLDDTYALYNMGILAYSDSSDASYDYARSDDTRVEVYVDGTWVTVTPSFSLAKDTLTEISLGGVKAQKIRITFNNTQTENKSMLVSLWEVTCTGMVWGSENFVEDSSSNILLGTSESQLAVSGKDSSGNDVVTHSSFPYLSKAFDGGYDNTSRYAVYDRAPYTYSLEITLKAAYRLCTMHIYPFYDGSDTTAGYARSDDTTVEVYTNGTWITVTDSFVLEASSYTVVELGAISAEKIRINFKNTAGTNCASIREITCTTILPDLPDRTDLLEAYKALDSVATDSFGEEQVKKAQLDSLKDLLMDVEADEAVLLESVEAVNTATEALTEKITSGSITTDSYGDFSSYNLGLSDDVSVNLYGTFEGAPENSKVMIQYQDGRVDSVPLDELESDSSSRQVLSFDLAAAQMTEEFTVSVVFGDGTCTEDVTTSIRAYAETILNDPSYEAATPGVNDLIIAMLNYGAYAQQYFGYETDNLANAGYECLDSVDFGTVEEAKPDKSGELDELEPMGWTLALESEVNVRFYFATDNIGAYDFVVNKPDGNSEFVNAEGYYGNIYRVEIPITDASLIASAYTLTVTERATGKALSVEFSAMDYVDTVIANETENENLLNVAKAIKLYCIEAVAYHTSSGSSMNVGG